MQTIFHRTAPILVLSVVLLAGVSLLGRLGPSLAYPQQATPARQKPDVTATISDTQTVYLPTVARNFPPPPTIFGVEINRGMVSATADRAGDAGFSWVRYNGIKWSDVEATQGVYDWSALSGIEAELERLSAEGVTPIVIVRSTPTWAQARQGVYCGPIKTAALDDFANFLTAVVERYSAAPYNVKYWEIWNEPDAGYRLVSSTGPFGCWGDRDAPYYGGDAYAEMLKYAYPAIKDADPSANVILGGLLLDCDPTHDSGCKAGSFLEGILQNGGGDYFDVLAYHAYPHWGAGTHDWDLIHTKWKHRGGMLLGKLDFIRALFTAYGVDRPIMMNEGGLLCHPTTDCPEDELRSAQANYLVRLYTRAWAHDLIGATWYTLNGPGWRQGGLLDGDQQPRPAYETLTFLTTLLRDARYDRQLRDGTVEGYAFRNGATEYQIYWSNDGTTLSLSLPAGIQDVYDKFGNSLLPLGTAVTIGFEPVILEVQAP